MNYDFFICAYPCIVNLCAYAQQGDAFGCVVCGIKMPVLCLTILLSKPERYNFGFVLSMGAMHN